MRSRGGGEGAVALTVVHSVDLEVRPVEVLVEQRVRVFLQRRASLYGDAAITNSGLLTKPMRFVAEKFESTSVQRI